MPTVDFFIALISIGKKDLQCVGPYVCVLIRVFVGLYTKVITGGGDRFALF